MKKTGTIVGIRPVLSQILVEHLTAQEASGTRLTISDNAELGAPQAYIVALGPNLKSEEIGLAAGDRVVLQGTYVPMPKLPGEKRRQGVVELHNIKAVLVEETEE